MSKQTIAMTTEACTPFRYFTGDQADELRDNGDYDLFEFYGDVFIRQFARNRIARQTIPSHNQRRAVIAAFPHAFDDHPRLYRYNDAEYLCAATDDELAESLDAAKRDGGAGVIRVRGVRCYVEEN